MQYMKPKNQMMGSMKQPKPFKKKTPMKKKKKPMAKKRMSRVMPKY